LKIRAIQVELMKGKAMPNCELIKTCPFYNNYFQDILEPNEYIKKEYCHDKFILCGRYLNYKRIEAERNLIRTDMTPIPGIRENRKAQYVV